jgi:hypothetical protein
MAIVIIMFVIALVLRRILNYADQNIPMEFANHKKQKVTQKKAVLLSGLTRLNVSVLLASSVIFQKKKSNKQPTGHEMYSQNKVT